MLLNTLVIQTFPSTDTIKNRFGIKQDFIKSRDWVDVYSKKAIIASDRPK
jgi:hypothetical protein